MTALAAIITMFVGVIVYDYKHYIKLLLAAISWLNDMRLYGIDNLVY